MLRLSQLVRKCQVRLSSLSKSRWGTVVKNSLQLPEDLKLHFFLCCCFHRLTVEFAIWVDTAGHSGYWPCMEQVWHWGTADGRPTSARHRQGHWAFPQVAFAILNTSFQKACIQTVLPEQSKANRGSSWFSSVVFSSSDHFLDIVSEI